MNKRTTEIHQRENAKMIKKNKKKYENKRKRKFKKQNMKMLIHDK